jgi:tetratricopeptide (TPR) repeat protein
MTGRLPRVLLLVLLAVCGLPDPVAPCALGQDADAARLLREQEGHAERARELRRRGRPAEAVAAAEKALAVDRRLWADQPGKLADSLEWLAGLRAECEDFATARKALEEALAIRTKARLVTIDTQLALAEVERLATKKDRGEGHPD